MKTPLPTTKQVECLVRIPGSGIDWKTAHECPAEIGRAFARLRGDKITVPAKKREIPGELKTKEGRRAMLTALYNKETTMTTTTEMAVRKDYEGFNVCDLCCDQSNCEIHTHNVTRNACVRCGTETITHLDGKPYGFDHDLCGICQDAKERYEHEIEAEAEAEAAYFQRMGVHLESYGY